MANETSTANEISTTNETSTVNETNTANETSATNETSTVDVRYAVMSHRWKKGYVVEEPLPEENVDEFWGKQPASHSSVLFQSHDGGETWSVKKKKGFGAVEKIIKQKDNYLPKKTLGETVTTVRAATKFKALLSKRTSQNDPSEDKGSRSSATLSLNARTSSTRSSINTNTNEIGTDRLGWNEQNYETVESSNNDGDDQLNSSTLSKRIQIGGTAFSKFTPTLSKRSLAPKRGSITRISGNKKKSAIIAMSNVKRSSGIAGLFKKKNNKDVSQSQKEKELQKSKHPTIQQFTFGTPVVVNIDDSKKIGLIAGPASDDMYPVQINGNIKTYEQKMISPILEEKEPETMNIDKPNDAIKKAAEASNKAEEAIKKIEETSIKIDETIKGGEREKKQAEEVIKNVEKKQ